MEVMGGNPVFSGKPTMSKKMRIETTSLDQERSLLRDEIYKSGEEESPGREEVRCK